MADAGGVWRNWDEIEFEPHIRHLTRAQLKEYVRLRQQHKEAGETPPGRRGKGGTASSTLATHQRQPRAGKSPERPAASPEVEDADGDDTRSPLGSIPNPDTTGWMTFRSGKGGGIVSPSGRTRVSTMLFIS
jgi:hypothetical protein